MDLSKYDYVESNFDMFKNNFNYIFENKFYEIIKCKKRSVENKVFFFKVKFNEELNNIKNNTKKEKINKISLKDNKQNCKIFFFNFYPKDTNNLIVLKIGKEQNFIGLKEYNICRDLESLGSFLPNFMRSLCLIENSYNFNINPSYNDLLFCEYIPHYDTLNTYMKTNKFSEKTKSIIIQILLCIFISQTKINFVHNDLHYDNILIKETLDNIFILYIYNYGNNIYYSYIPSFGKIPVIIDYGMSYTKNVNFFFNGSDFDNKGFITNYFDKHSDCKLFLYKMLQYKIPLELEQKISKIYKNCKIEKSGWDDECDMKSTNDCVCNIIRSIEYDIDRNLIIMIISLSKIPITKTPNDITNLELKIVIKSFYDKLTILRQNIRNKKLLELVFFILIKELQEHISKLDNKTITKINYNDIEIKIKKICQSTNKKIKLTLDIKELIDSILSLSYCIDYLIFKNTNSIKNLRKESYKDVPDIISILQTLKQELKIDFLNKPKDKLIILNSIKESSSFVYLKQQHCDILNSYYKNPDNKWCDFFKKIKYSVK